MTVSRCYRHYLKKVVRIERVVLPYKDLEAGRSQLMWTLSSATTWETAAENRSVECHHYYYYCCSCSCCRWWYFLYGFSSDHPFQVYYKMRRLIQRVDRTYKILQAQYCNADRTTWKLTLQDINTTPKELKTERDYRQLFRRLWGSSVWRDNTENSGEKYPRTLILRDWFTIMRMCEFWQ